MNQLAVSGNNYAMNVGQLGAVWGVSGVVLILVYAIARLTVITLEAFDYSFAWWHWVLLVLNVVFMVVSLGLNPAGLSMRAPALQEGSNDGAKPSGG